MATVQDELLIKISADINDLKTGMNSAKQIVKGSSQNMGRSIMRLAKAFVAWTVVVRLARAAIRQFTASVNRIDDLQKYSQALGVSTEMMAAFNFAAQLSGVSVRQLQVGLKMMAKNIGDAAQGFGEGRLALKKLRLDLATLQRMSPDQQFQAVAEAMTHLSTTSERTSVAMKLFGESGIKLIPLLDQGAAGMDKAAKATKRLGTALSRAQTEDVTKMKDGATELGEAWRGMADQFVVSVAPSITKSLKSISKEFSEIAGWYKFIQQYGGLSALLDPEAAVKKMFSDRAAKGHRAFLRRTVRTQMEAIDDIVAEIKREKEAREAVLAEEYAWIEMNEQRKRELQLMGLTDEERAIEESFDKRTTELNEFFENRIALMDEDEAAQLELKRQWAEIADREERKRIKDREELEHQSAQRRRDMQQEVANNTIAAIRGVVEASGAGAREQFEWAKALSIAEATVNTASAIMKYHSEGRPAMAWTAGIIGAAQIAKIAATTLEGGGGAAVAGAAAAPAEDTGASATVTRDVNVTLVGDAFGPEGIRNLMGRIQEENEDGAQMRLNVI